MWKVAWNTPIAPPQNGSSSRSRQARATSMARSAAASATPIARSTTPPVHLRRRSPGPMFGGQRSVTAGYANRMLPVVTLAVAVAAEPEPPLAIPAHEAPSPPPAAVSRPPQVAVAYDGRMARAMRDYRGRYLSLRQMSEIAVGTTMTYGWYGGWGTAGHAGWGGWVAVPQPWLAQRDVLAVYEGPRRIDMPATHRTLGDPAGAEKLESKMRSNRTAAGFLYTIGVAGMVASIGGLIAAENADTWEEANEWTTVSWIGVGATVFGFVGGSIPSAQARRLQADPSASFDLDELQARINSRNDALAAELGLPPELAVGLEPP